MTYAALEEALVTQIRTLSRYTDGNCKAGDVDGVFKFADQQSQITTYYRDNICYVDYNGGRALERNFWRHSVLIVCGVRVEDVTAGATTLPAAGSVVRDVVEEMRGLLHPNNTLGGITSRCALVNIGTPLVITHGTGVWVLCLMSVEIDELAARC